MKRTAFVVLLLIAVTGHAKPPADIDWYAQRVLSTFETPGLVLTIVEQGHASVVRSYGLRRMGEPTKVDEHTLFAIGSTTKAFTTALLAMLVDEGKLTWDTKVTDVLPGFKLYDAYASSEMTVRDLLVHRSGLNPGAGDLMFFPPSSFTRAEIIHNLRYIKPATSFRSAFAYDNLLYIAAGQVIEVVCASPWDEVVRKRILSPLHMDETTTSAVMTEGANRAWPHARISGAFRGEGPMRPLDVPLNVDVAAAAGAINASGSDIARWLQLQLGHGVDPKTGARLYSDEAARQMWSAQTLIPIAPNPKRLELANANYRAYALGWIVSDYRGHPIISHGGGVSGSVTQIVILPERAVAFAIMTNSEEVGALSAIQYRLLDYYLGLKSPDWTTAVAETFKERVTQARDQLAKSNAWRESGAREAKGPSLPLASYAGKYRDPWYGLVTIENTPAGLGIRFNHTPSMAGPLEHVRYDTFRTRWTDRTIEDAYVTFALSPDGSVERMTMQAISPLADFSFDYQDLLFRPEA